MKKFTKGIKPRTGKEITFDLSKFKSLTAGRRYKRLAKARKIEVIHLEPLTEEEDTWLAEQQARV